MPSMLVDSTTTTTPISNTRSAAKTSLPDLPEDVFLLVLQNLAAWDVICCQMVSRSWREAFSKEEYLQIVLKRYPDAREVRQLTQSPETDLVEDGQVGWLNTFQVVAARYYHLKHGKARSVERHKLTPSDQHGHFYPVGEWDYHESQPGGRLYYQHATHTNHISTMGSKPYLFRYGLWSYEDGLLVFAPADRTIFHNSGEILGLLDIARNNVTVVPFDISDKIIRNLRLNDRTLIIEWAEKDPFHDLNDMEQVNRHFASCYDVRYLPIKEQWDVTFRSEWKMHFLGLPLNSRDRFFSTHDSNHYVVYFWQPNRSMYTGDEENPIESLSVWSISQPSQYRPSTDPSGKSPLRPNSDSVSHGPHVLTRLPFADLDYLGIRQHSNIRLMSLILSPLTSGPLGSPNTDIPTLTFRENISIEGQGYFDPALRLFNCTSTTFPIIGEGPHLRREYEGEIPPYRGHCSMESAEIETMENWYVPIMDVIDAAAQVKLSLVETCFTGQMMVMAAKVLRIKALGEWVTMDDTVTKEVGAMGRISGDERWVIGQNEKLELVVARF